MNIQQLQQQIKTNNFDNIYVFTGDEIAIQKIYINKIADKANLELQYVDSFSKIYNKLDATDIFNTKKLYVILDDTEFIKAEKVWNDFNINTNNNIIIFKFNVLDKRNKFYKIAEPYIVEFNKLSNDVLLQYIKKDLPDLSDDYCSELINICGNNYNQILLEIDKIKNYMQYLNETNDSSCYTNSYFQELNKSGAFHKEISDITFEFIEKVLKRDIVNIFDLLKKLKQIDEPNIKLISLLYTNFKTILLIQSCKSNDICKTTGLQYYQVKYNQDKLNYYTIGELVRALKILQKLEKNIKVGTIDETIVIDYFLVSIL